MVSNTKWGKTFGKSSPLPRLVRKAFGQRTTKLRRQEVTRLAKWGNGEHGSRVVFIPKSPRNWLRLIASLKGPAAYLLTLSVFGSREERLGQE